MRWTRRSVLGTAATVGIGTVAGCLGDDESSSDDDDSENTGGDEPDRSENDSADDDRSTDESGEDEPEDDGPWDLPVAGDPNADVTVTVYEDYACSHCREFKLSVFPQIEEAYLDSGDVRYEQRDFPLPVDRTWSWVIPCAVREVYEEWGDEAYWAFSKAIFEHQGSYSHDVIERVANEQELDGTQVRQAAENERHRSTIEAERAAAADAGIEVTPTVLVDGRQLQLTEISFEQVAEPIDAALEG